MSETKNKKYIVRTERAGVFYAEIAERRGTEADLVNARRVWQWKGATECIGLATSGCDVSSRLTVPANLTVLGVIEIHPCTPEAVKRLDAVPEWKL